MKLIKSILLGAATGVVGVAAASAADLPRLTKGPAVSYVKVCDTYGAGFFYVPGSSDTCIKIGGFIRADYNLASVHNFGTRTIGAAAGLASVTSSAAQKTDNFFARFGLGADVRTATQYGVLRAYGLGEFNTGNVTFGNTANVRAAFVQFAGLTAGQAESFFDFYGYGADYNSLRDSYQPTRMLAYTATFGGGFSASLGLEANSTRQNAFLVDPLVPGAISIGGTRMPDVVANLRVDQGWGSAQLSGALHQSIAVVNAVGLPLASSTRSTTGYAVQAGVKINLPMLAAGDALWIEGAYASGATAYLGFGSNQSNSLGGAFQSGAELSRPEYDVAVLNGGILQKQTGFQVMAALNHYWTPTVAQAFLIGYSSLNPGQQTFAATGVGKWNELRLASQLTWYPVAGFQIGFEGEYASVRETVNATTAAALAANNLKPNYGTWNGKLRIQRSF